MQVALATMNPGWRANSRRSSSWIDVPEFQRALVAELNDAGPNADFQVIAFQETDRSYVVGLSEEIVGGIVGWKLLHGGHHMHFAVRAFRKPAQFRVEACMEPFMVQRPELRSSSGPWELPMEEVMRLTLTTPRRVVNIVSGHTSTAAAPRGFKTDAWRHAVIQQLAQRAEVAGWDVLCGDYNLTGTSQEVAALLPGWSVYDSAPIDYPLTAVRVRGAVDPPLTPAGDRNVAICGSAVDHILQVSLLSWPEPPVEATTHPGTSIHNPWCLSDDDS